MRRRPLSSGSPLNKLVFVFLLLWWCSTIFLLPAGRGGEGEMEYCTASCRDGGRLCELRFIQAQLSSSPAGRGGEGGGWGGAGMDAVACLLISCLLLGRCSNKCDVSSILGVWMLLLLLLAGHGGEGWRERSSDTCSICQGEFAATTLACHGGEERGGDGLLLCRSEGLKNGMSAQGFVQHEAQIFNYFFWSYRLCVTLRNQGNISNIHTYNLVFEGRTAVRKVRIAEPRAYQHNSYKALLQIVGCASYAIEQVLPSTFSCTWLSWFNGKLGVDTVPVVRVDPSAVDDNAAVAVPQIQQRGLLSLSSVMDNMYLQLNTPLPRTQLPDRLSGEPPAGHQLVCVNEAFEDCSCGTFGSELLTDGRSPFGFFCSLRCWYLVLSLALSGVCHLSGMFLALFIGATMFYIR